MKKTYKNIAKKKIFDVKNAKTSNKLVRNLTTYHILISKTTHISNNSMTTPNILKS